MPFGIQQLPQLLGIIYALVLIPLVAYLWYSGKFSRKAGYLFLILTTLFGFLLFAPMAPWQLGLALEGRVQALPVPIYGVYAILGVLLVFTLVAGRIFCGHFCPIGTAQELAYLVPVRKVILRHKTITMAFRWAVFIVFVITALFLSNSILRLFGIHEFFHLNTASALFIVFVAILLVSIVVYRPFCRLFCPFGAVLSLAAARSIFKFRKDRDTCIECGLCAEACPTQEADPDSSKAECYMCGRCVEACKKGDTLRFRREV